MSSYRLTQTGGKRKLQDGSFRTTERGGATPSVMTDGFLLTRGLGGDFLVTSGYGTTSSSVVTSFPSDGGSSSVFIASASTLFGFANPHRTRPVVVVTSTPSTDPSYRLLQNGGKRKLQNGSYRFTEA